MSSLIGRSPKESFKEILTLNHQNGIDSSLHIVCDGAGNASRLSLSSSQIALNGNIWPTTGSYTNTLLRMSATSNLMEWTVLSTSDVPEGTNRYLTNSRVWSALTGINGITVNKSTGEISYTGGSSSSSLTLSLATKSITGNYTITSTDSTIRVNASSGDIIITIPASSSLFDSETGKGQVFNIKKTDSSENTITLVCSGSDHIDGLTTKVIINQYSSLMIQANGSSWDVI